MGRTICLSYEDRLKNLGDTERKLATRRYVVRAERAENKAASKPILQFLQYMIEQARYIISEQYMKDVRKPDEHPSVEDRRSIEVRRQAGRRKMRKGSQPEPRRDTEGVSCEG